MIKASLNQYQKTLVCLSAMNFFSHEVYVHCSSKFNV